MPKILSLIWEIIIIVIIALIIAIPVRIFIFQPFFVWGDSMEPNFHNFDYLIIDEISYRLGEPQRGEVIVFYSPAESGQRLIKRIIGLPGETVKVQDGAVYIRGQEDEEFVLLDESEYLPKGTETDKNRTVSLEQGQYFVLGDNRNYSRDSRVFGPVDEKNIIGRSVFKILNIGFLKGE